MKDRRDSWAAAEDIIPSSSNAARALRFIWKDLKITGKAYRVPIRTGSIAELNLITERPVTVDEINAALRKSAATAPLKGVMGVREEGWASSRILGDPHSSIVDLPLTAVPEGAMLSVAAWYDNEMGYATRLAETAAWIAGKGGAGGGGVVSDGYRRPQQRRRFRAGPRDRAAMLTRLAACRYEGTYAGKMNGKK
jgi:glyceraldehyde 3-phosphate dehydrogenase